jgi:predicted nucleotidyltransferase
MDNPFQYSGLRVLKLFFDEPYRDFYLREIAKLVDVSPSTAKGFLDFYENRGLLLKSRRANLVLFKANVENPSFRSMKVGLFLLKAEPLIDFLKRKYADSSIVLYGSCARGEDDSESDADLLAVGRRNDHVDVSAYEKQLGGRITLLVYASRQWEEKAKEDKAFYERILVDGVMLHGSLPVVKG